MDKKKNDIAFDIEALKNALSVTSLIRNANPNLDLHYEFCRILADGLVSVSIETLTRKDTPEQENFFVRFRYDLETVSLLQTSPLWDSMPEDLKSNIFRNVFVKENGIREMLLEFYNPHNTIRQAELDIRFHTKKQYDKNGKSILPSMNLVIFLDSFEDCRDLVESIMEDIKKYKLDLSGMRDMDVPTLDEIMGSLELSDSNLFDDDEMGDEYDASFETCQLCPAARTGCDGYDNYLKRLDREDPQKANELRTIVASGAGISQDDPFGPLSIILDHAIRKGISEEKEIDPKDIN